MKDLTLYEVKELVILATKLFYMRRDELGVLDETQNEYEYVAAISRVFISISPNCSVAFRYLAFCIQNNIPIIEQDLVGTKFEGQRLEEINSSEFRDQFITELLEKVLLMNPIDRSVLHNTSFYKNELESISGALFRYKKILEESPSITEPDFVRISIVGIDAPSLETITSLLNWQIRQYLEIEYIKQERLLILSNDLRATAWYLFSDPNTPITEKLLLDTKWAGQPPDQVDRYELSATYARFALKYDPKNGLAMEIVADCFKRGVPIDTSDLQSTAFAKQPIEEVDFKELGQALYDNIYAWDLRLRKAISPFLRVKNSKEDAMVERKYSFEKIREEKIEPERKRRSRSK